MGNVLLNTAVQTWFAFMSRGRASKTIREMGAKYLALAGRLNAETGSLAVHVPKMPGVGQEMRNWSFFMLLEHNAIVNRSITSVVESLVHGEEPRGAGAIDPKRDVMPAPDSGKEQVEAFADSVREHLAVVSGLGPLRGSATKRHPIFGDFDAHKWHCMFAFHLRVHHNQAQYIVRKIET